MAVTTTSATPYYTEVLQDRNGNIQPVNTVTTNTLTVNDFTNIGTNLFVTGQVNAATLDISSNASIGGTANIETLNVNTNETVIGNLTVEGTSTLEGVTTFESNPTFSTSAFGVEYVHPNIVDQATSISTGVTCNTTCGSILTQATTLAAGSTTAFFVSNNVINEFNHAHITWAYIQTSSYTPNTAPTLATAGCPVLQVGDCQNSPTGFTINILNGHTTTALNGQFLIHFIVF